MPQQKSDVIFLQETYSSADNVKFWENEWGGKIFASHGSNHSRGVMILFKPRDLSTTIINQYANEKVILGGDFNCPLSNIDKRGGRSLEHKKMLLRNSTPC